jgi:hypothetical protein
VSDLPVPPVTRTHLEAITGPLGIFQHALGEEPDPIHGVCTDDVARAFTVDVIHARTLGWEAVRPSAVRSFAFLRSAYNLRTSRFRNFRAADGTWLDVAGSEDTQARALRALSLAATAGPDNPLRHEAAALFRTALPVANRLRPPRAVAAAILGCDTILQDGADGRAERALSDLASRLRPLFAAQTRGSEWPWPEPIVTYENALLPHALLVVAQHYGDPTLARVALRVLDWLIDEQTSADGMFSPIGNQGWWLRGGARATFDQQPIEATTMIEACAAALAATGDAHYGKSAEMAYAWFLGANDSGLPVAVVATGGCHDGLAATEVNVNQGAESTIMWQLAVEAVRELRARPAQVVTA